MLSRRRFAAALLSSTALAAALPAAAHTARPNIITIVLDDVGFSDLGCFGAEIRTPNLDRLAAAGLRFNRFDTKAVCSPTRAALLTGRNSHTVNMPDVPDAAAGAGAANWPPGSFHMPANVQTTAQVLRGAGYATWIVGKWHLIPMGQLDAEASKENWPLQRGFDYFYGFPRGWTDQYRPTLVENDGYIQPKLPEGYHLSADLIDRSISLIETHRGEGGGRPFFLHLGLGVAHSPIQVPASYSDRYKGAYDGGWDAIRQARFQRMKQLGVIPADCALPDRTDDDRAWSDLSDDERAVFARYMEVYAGFIEHADEQIGRLLAKLEAAKLLDNTLIVVLSDNGAASEAGQAGFFAELYRPNTIPVSEQRRRLAELGTGLTQAEYPRPWAIAGSAPFRRYKLWPYLGGVRTPLIVSWPARIKDGGAVRGQYVDVVDVGPTLLDAAGLRFESTVNGVAQLPVAGRSFLAALSDRHAETRSRQYLEVRGHRAITDGPWRAVAIHDCDKSYEQDTWQLFNTAQDFTEAHDLAGARPEVLQRMKTLWADEWRIHVARPLSQPPPNICRLNSEYSRATMTRPDR
ncbi:MULTISPECIES: arylsulfatase [unclassified Phenylobacterium]|uniref:arylsulfatase n=1 Tax=unclassified Phenylobacterium TaxID=2640670 RepID=UPI000AAF1CBC|nr:MULTISPECIES: arylsulfatase [unclassified Phenylobacterium]